MDNLQAQPRKKVNKTGLILLLILMFGLIGLALYNKDNLYKLRYMFVRNETINAATIFKRNIDPAQSASFVTYEGKILWITNQGIKALSLNNQIEWEINKELIRPIVMAQGKYFIVADGGNLSLYKEDKLLWTKTLEGTISNAGLNKTGFVFAVVQKEGTNGQIVGYSLKGQTIFNKDYSGQSYLVDADISQDNKKAVVLSIDSSSSRVSSKLDIFDLKSSQNISVLKEDTLATEVKAFNNGNIVLIADNKIMVLDSQGNDKNVVSFGDSKVYSADISSENYIILETKGTIKSNLLENKSREIRVYDGNGKIQGDGVKITSAIQDTDIFDDYFIANDGVNLYSISKGKLIWTYPLSNNIKCAKGFLGKPQILLVSNNSIEVIEAN